MGHIKLPAGVMFLHTDSYPEPSCGWVICSHTIASGQVLIHQSGFHNLQDSRELTC